MPAKQIKWTIKNIQLPGKKAEKEDKGNKK